MCTAIWDAGLMGRTLDLERSLSEKIVLMPREYPLKFLHEGEVKAHPAIIGTATVREGFPLYYDAMNEAGLAVCGLNFPKYGHYCKRRDGARNIASFEFVPLILSRCKSVADARELLLNAVICDDSFSKELAATPLHWMIGDSMGCIVVEPCESGLKVYDNPVGVLTNSPPLPYHLTRLADYAGLGAENPDNRLSDYTPMVYSRGLGSFGLPGDYSSSSRFTRAVFIRAHTKRCDKPVTRFFRMAEGVSVPRGCIVCEFGREVATVYTSCMDLLQGYYYYTTYGSHAIHAVGFDGENIDSENLTVYPHSTEEIIIREGRKSDFR